MLNHKKINNLKIKKNILKIAFPSKFVLQTNNFTPPHPVDFNNHKKVFKSGASYCTNFVEKMKNILILPFWITFTFKDKIFMTRILTDRIFKPQISPFINLRI